MSNQVQISSVGQVLVTQIAEGTIEVQSPNTALTVEVVTQGPQGQVAPFANLTDLEDVAATSKVDKSVLYYDATTQKWRGDSIYTVLTLTDGGAF